jgi:hypothetical protein
MRHGEIKLFRCLCDHRQFGNRGGRVAPIDLESIPFSIRLSDRHQSSAELADYLQARDIPGESFWTRFMGPTIYKE